MNRIMVLFVFVLLSSAVNAAQIKVAQKSFLVPTESGTYHYPSSIATNTANGRSLVVWTGGGDGIRGRVIDAQGNPIGEETLLVSTPGIYRPFVVYNSVRNEFLLTFDDNDNWDDPTSSIFVKRLSPTGKPGGKAINITNAAGLVNSWNINPMIVYNPKTGGYILTWNRLDSSRNLFVAGTLLNDKGNVNGPVVTIVPSDQPAYPLDIGYQSSSDKLLVVSRFSPAGGGLSSEWDYLLASVDSSLKNAPVISKVNDRTILRGRDWFFVGADLVITDQSAMVFYSANDGVKRRNINQLGKLSGAPVNAFNGSASTIEMKDPSAAFSTTSKATFGVLVASQDDEPPGIGTTWAQALDRNGAPTGTPKKVDQTILGETQMLGRSGALPVNPNDKILRFIWYATRSDARRNFRYSGIFQLNLNLTP